MSKRKIALVCLTLALLPICWPQPQTGVSLSFPTILQSVSHTHSRPFTASDCETRLEIKAHVSAPSGRLSLGWGELHFFFPSATFGDVCHFSHPAVTSLCSMSSFLHGEARSVGLPQQRDSLGLIHVHCLLGNRSVLCYTGLCSFVQPVFLSGRTERTETRVSVYDVEHFLARDISASNICQSVSIEWLSGSVVIQPPRTMSVLVPSRHMVAFKKTSHKNRAY